MDKNNGRPDAEPALGEGTSCLLRFKPLIMFLERKRGDLLGAAELCARGQVQTVEPASVRLLHRLPLQILAPGREQTSSEQTPRAGSEEEGLKTAARAKMKCWNSGGQRGQGWQRPDGQSTCWHAMERTSFSRQ